MSSKPFIEKLKPDFKIVVNGYPIQCLKSKCLELSELLSDYLNKSPKDPNSFSIKLTYVTVENDFLLIKEIFTNFSESSFIVKESNSNFLFKISETFKIKKLEIILNNYLDDKLTISRSFEKDEGCFLMKRIESIVVNLKEENLNESIQKVDTILILPPKSDSENDGFRIDKILFCRILLDVMISLIEKVDLYLSFIEKLRDSSEIVKTFHDIFVERINEKHQRIVNFQKQNMSKSHHLNEYHSFFMSQSFCFILRKFIKKKWFSSDEISEYDFFSPIMADCVHNINRYELSLLFHNYSENIERMKQNNWKYHSMYCNIGHNEDPLMAILRKDDIEGFISVSGSKKKYKFFRPVFRSAFERYDFVNGNCEIIEYAAFFGSVKCFEYILENLEFIPKCLTRFVVAGANKEIIKICEQKSLTFYNCLDVAIKFHHWNLFEWLCENKYQNINREELLEETFANSNFRSLLLLLGKGVNFSKFLVWSLKYKNYILADFYLSLNLKTNYLNEYDEKTGMAALHFACLHGYDAILLKLIKKEGINVNILSKKEKMSLLHYCCINGSKHLCENILSIDHIDVNSVNYYGKTPLHLACENGYSEIVELLLKRKEININIKTIEEKTPLISACENGSLDIFNQIMEKESVIYDRLGEISILQASCSSKNLELVKRAASLSKLSFTYYTASTMTPLSNACSKGSIEIVKYLIEEQQVDYNQIDLIGQIPLNLACKNGQDEIAFYLFQLPKIKLTGESLVLSTSSNRIKIVQKILSFDDNDFPFVDYGLEALCIACKKGLVEIVELLVNSGKIELNPKTDKMGPLHYACKYGYPDIVRILINNPKVDINLFSTEEIDERSMLLRPDKIPNPHHMSPLHFAIKENNTECAKLLLEDKRIDVNSKAHGILIFVYFFL